jgi:hypothetical protein
VRMSFVLVAKPTSPVALFEQLAEREQRGEGVLRAFRGRVFKLPDASREFLSVCEMAQAAARAQV